MLKEAGRVVVLQHRQQTNLQTLLRVLHLYRL
ncbi:unnamed protein product [Nippostrongylus brasiliensis]|uniref:Methyltransferase n=1 Tax=Nippostrongylus brasiliensis TaxID=27835 RepID=A0A0N4YSN6_NIPBR|nr:unnamed protein product [Nippostrongylus brasiliensis]